MFYKVIFVEQEILLVDLAINTTVGILGIFDPATKLGFEASRKRRFWTNLGVWGTGSGCYFVLPILGPTTTQEMLLVW